MHQRNSYKNTARAATVTKQKQLQKTAATDKEHNRTDTRNHGRIYRNNSGTATESPQQQVLKHDRNSCRNTTSAATEATQG